MDKMIIDERVPIKIWTNDIEEEAIEQLKNTARLPFVFKHIAVMPDVHAGKGSTVGSVIATKNAVCPAAVGVDIGCGMSALKTDIDANYVQDQIKIARERIESFIPVGFNQHNKPISWFEYPKNWSKFDLDKASKQIGTLGGGNHFIEICLDKENKVWILLHSGSRNIGKVVADYHINKAKGFMKDMFISLPDPDLAYFAQSQSEFKTYVDDVLKAQEYAKHNRLTMMRLILNIFGYSYADIDSRIIDCHHNYLSLENHFGENVWITRKGAVSARQGQMGIIPGSMGAKSYIVRGLGNTESFCSCSHGAGRKMSRTKARNTFTQDDLILQTQGVECRKDEDIIDEIPSAYKDIDIVMENQKDLVEIVHELKQIMCIKG